MTWRRAALFSAAAAALATLGALYGGCKSAAHSSRVSECAPVPMHGVAKAAFHGDAARTGWNASESALTPAAVGGGGFGSIWQSPAFDALTLGGATYAGRMYASPLYLDDVDITGGDFAGQRLSVVLAATSNGFVYAVNAFATPCKVGDAPAGAMVWRARVGEASVVPLLDGRAVSPAFAGIALGVLSTPVVDTRTSPPRLYVVSMDKRDGAPPTWRAYALDLGSGAVLPGWPVALEGAAIEPSNTNGPTRFDPDALEISQRSALALSPSGDALYVAFGGYADHAAGWLVAVDTRAARVSSSFAAARGARIGEASGGLWGAGGAAIDAEGNVYLTSGNSPPADAAAGAPGVWGNTLLQWRADLTLRATYSPWNFCQNDSGDTDLGGDSPLLLPDLDPSTTSTPHLVAFGSKQGTVYLLDRDHIPGGTSARPSCSARARWDDAAKDASLLPPSGAPYCDPTTGVCGRGPLSVFGPYSDDPNANQVNAAKMRSTPAYFRDASGAHVLFVAGASKRAEVSPESAPPSFARLRVNLAPGAPAYLSVDAYEPTVAFVNAGSPVVSSDGPNGAIVWVVDQNATRTQPLLDPSTPHPLLHAFDGSSMKLLWRSGETELFVGGKYVTPAIAHGAVFVGTDRIQAFGLRQH